MKRSLSLAAVISLLLLTAGHPRAVSSSIVISQIYGGGGNAGATFKNDFIELFYRGATTLNLTGWSVQYGLATGSTWSPTPLSGTIHPGPYYLVQEAPGAGGSVNLPTPDATGSIAMGATAGKVILANVATPLSGSCPSGAAVVDLVGYGTTANCFEDGAATAAPSNTTAVLRAESGCSDSDSNASDFAVGAPSPRNTASPLHFC